MSIAVVKRIIESRIAMGIDEQQLYYDKIALRDEETIDGYPIRKDSILELRRK